ncbi:MAG: aminopeptidase [Spirochaetaceae bacterium]|jgi:predicted aminopeptidase|nr:aminopeptidase [Spirochaetaceae bacterium]
MRTNTFFCFFPVLAAALFLLLVSMTFSACYTLKQGGIMLGYLGRAVPLDSLIEGNNPPQENIEFVELVTDIRRFAVEYLGLNETKNYARYVDIDRDYLAAIVSASAKDSFKRYEWRFPIVGSVPYKGFFITDDARKEAEKLRRKDLDVWIRPVDAFSTLGWFSDPLYSFMRDYSPERMANLLIHELVHATVFIKDNMQFNEELAEFIGSEGARLYIENRYGNDSPQMENITYSSLDNAAYVTFIQELISELDSVYKSGIPREEKLEQKEKIIAAAQTRFADEYETRFHSGRYRAFSEMTINNAYLELYRLYYAGGSELKELYDESGGDLRAFIAAAKTIKKGGGKPMEQLRSALKPPAAFLPRPSSEQGP